MGVMETNALIVLKRKVNYKKKKSMFFEINDESSVDLYAVL